MQKQIRRDFLKTMGCAAATAGTFLLLPNYAVIGKMAEAKRKQPNVILVMTDDQGYGDLGCHGNNVIQTPNLDNLYKESIRFTNFHVSPTCSPTRAGLMTGRYCNRTGVWHTIMGRSLLRKDEVTMADVFSAGDYKTGFFGKWHLGDNYPFSPQYRGFDEVIRHGGGGVGNTPDYWGNNYFDDTYFHNGNPEKFTGFCTDVWFDEAMKFIEANKDQPFFVYLPTNAPHGPLNVPEKYSKPYKDKGVEDRRANFYGTLTNFDENMGRLMQQLKRLELAENTILIFLTDNGGTAGHFNAGMRGKKGSEYEGGHRVPCFIRWPDGLTSGKDIDRLSANIDLLPTLIDLCELDKPDGVKFDGDSLVPLLTGKAQDWSDRTLVVDSQRIEHPKMWRKSTVMTEHWRLVNGKELYDIQADPGQKNNVADKYPDVARKLRDEYEKWWEDISQRFDEYCETIVGSDAENPVRLTSHDWHGPDVPWNQWQIRSGMQANGFWAVEIAESGKYEFSLRRWPSEVNKPITSTVPASEPVPDVVNPYPAGKAISATKARLKIANVDVSKPIPKEAATVRFQVQLEAGKTRLQTWFIDEKSGESRGAYYVYVKRF